MPQFWGFEEAEAGLSRREDVLTGAERRPRRSARHAGRSARHAGRSPCKQTPDSACDRPRFTDFRKDPFKVFNSADLESEHFL